MDNVSRPSAQANPPTQSSDPKQQSQPSETTDISNQDITARQAASTGTVSADDSANDGSSSQKFESNSQGIPGAHINPKLHTKGKAAPDSHSALFGLTPEENKVHPPRTPPVNDSSSSSSSSSDGEGGRVRKNKKKKGTEGEKKDGQNSSLLDRLKNPLGGSSTSSGNERKDDYTYDQGERKESANQAANKSTAQPSLLSRLNPMADSTGDGQKGMGK